MTRPLDVLLVSQPVSYGVAVFVRQLAEAAVAAGHRVTVVCPGPERGPLAGWVRAAGAEHRTLDMARQPGPRDLVDLWSLRRLARGRDVVHLHSSKAAALGRLAVLTLGRRRPAVVVTPHYWSWLVGGRLAPLYRWVERVLAPRCDAIVAVSEAEAAEGRAVLPAADRITLIHNGVDRERFSPDRAAAERDPDAPLLVCVGRLSEQKGQDIAIRALACLSDPTVRLRLDRLGCGRDELVEELRNAGVGFSVHWRPLHLHPYYEGLGWRPDHCPAATETWPRLVSLPLYPGMTEEEVEHVVDTVARLCREQSRVGGA